MPRQITKLQELHTKRVTIKFETARAIRELLDNARTEWLAEDWDAEDIESEIIELVTSEGAQ